MPKFYCVAPVPHYKQTEEKETEQKMMMTMSGLWSLHRYLEHTHGHAHPGHRHQVALHPLLARPQAAALIDQQAVVLLLLVNR